MRAFLSGTLKDLHPQARYEPNCLPETYGFSNKMACLKLKLYLLPTTQKTNQQGPTYIISVISLEFQELIQNENSTVLIVSLILKNL